MFAAAVLAQAAEPPGDAVDDVPLAVAQTALGILGFAHWPDRAAELRLCVVGPSRYAGVLLGAAQAHSGALRVSVRQRAPVDAGTDCDAVYIGSLSEAGRGEVYRRIAGHAVLAIDERREACRGVGMFCLDVRPTGVGFEVNLDALARSGVRVHPAVLQLGRQAGKTP